MGEFKSVVDTCFSIMQLSIPLFGYQFTLWQVFIFSAISYAVVRLVFGIFR